MSVHKEVTAVRFPITVTGGTGSYKPSVDIVGTIHTRSINPPVANATYDYYVQDQDSDFIDNGSGRGLQNFNGPSICVGSPTFYIQNASADGTYTVTIWLEVQYGRKQKYTS